MAENLLVLTTAGRLHWLKGVIETLRDPLDVLVVDDASPSCIGIGAFCKQKGLKFLTKPKAKGLTDSWNTAYQFFRKHKYEGCILSNDDVLLPKGFSKGLLDGLEKFDLVGPVSNKPGHGVSQKVGAPVLGVSLTEDNIDQVQEALLQKYRESPLVEHSFVNGFCFAFSTTIQKFMFSDRLLLNPAHRNIGNEGDLVTRVNERGGKIAFCRTSYVWHFKKGTYRELKSSTRINRDQLWNY